MLPANELIVSGENSASASRSIVTIVWPPASMPGTSSGKYIIGPVRATLTPSQKRYPLWSQPSGAAELFCDESRTILGFDAAINYGNHFWCDPQRHLWVASLVRFIF